MRYGYARVSTKKQSLERQLKNIGKVYPDAVIIAEKFTGTTTDRPQWTKLYKSVKSGDCIVFDSVSRMSRNAEEGVRTYFELLERGVELVFLKEPYINTSTYINRQSDEIEPTGEDIDIVIQALNKYLRILAKKQIIIAFEQSEKEVEDLRQRIKEGQTIARLDGKHIGLEKGVKMTTKKSVEAKKQILRYSKAFEGSLNDADTMKLVGIAKNTYYKYKRELTEEQNSARNRAYTVSNDLN